MKYRSSINFVDTWIWIKEWINGKKKKKKKNLFRLLKMILKN